MRLRVLLLICLLTSVAIAATPDYRQAIAPREWSFPTDHGRHDAFKTEWWYFTGNLREKSTGRRFGYQLTFFRTAFTANPTTRPSAWAMTDLYLAHAAVSDIDGNNFLYTDRMSRGRDGLTGSAANTLDVYLKNWSAKLDRDVIKLISNDERFSSKARMRKPCRMRPSRRSAWASSEPLNPKITCWPVIRSS